jgi:DNA-binding transcriptional regulator GbsR (MarR family)
LLKIQVCRMNLPPLLQAFVLHFGEMGSRWGINRTVGQVYAVIFVSDKPVCADDLVDALGISRSNVAMAIKELQSWDLIRLKHVAGERRDFFVTLEDVWSIVRILVEQRKRREVDPTLTVLRELLMQPALSETEIYAQTRMQSMHEVIDLLTTWYTDVEKLETQRLVQLLSLGSKIVKVIDWKDRLFLVDGGSKTRRDRKAGGA